MVTINPARTVVITGASGGIGAATAAKLVISLPTLQHLILAVRNIDKAESVVAEPLRKGQGSRPVKVSLVPIELTDFTSISTCATKITDALGNDPLDLLINNAGVMACPLTYSKMQADKGPVELQYATNHLSHAKLTHALLPSLQKSEHGRVIFVSSLAAKFASKRDSAPVVNERVESVLKNGGYEKWKMYGESKLAMSMFARELAKRTNITSLSLHPGIVQTDLSRYLIPKFLQGSSDTFVGRSLAKVANVFGFKTPEQGAELSIELSEKIESELENGMMYMSTGLKKLQRRELPIFWNDNECSRLYEDTMQFIESASTE